LRNKTWQDVLNLTKSHSTQIYRMDHLKQPRKLSPFL